ncbi:MAG: stage IV sporulation protein A [Bacilli bacterium]|jgi:stage IV sporulation protein A
MSENIIRDVVFRTNGELYVGVVGSVRSGKSTFIRRFMELKVLPYIKDPELAKKVIDELPQSAEGRTIMTVEPKFVPSNNINITVSDDLKLNVRLVDCVGYALPSAKGYINDDGTSRLVKTPWFTEDIPFGDAAKIGTRKVIESHSNIGIVITSDGSFGEFTRSEYEAVEEKIIDELKELNKPFVIVLNTSEPNSEKTKKLCNELREKYGVAVVAVNAVTMKEADVDRILKEALYEFDISELSIKVPNWISSLHDDVPFKQAFNEVVSKTTSTYRKFRDALKIQDALKESEMFENVELQSQDLATGVVEINVDCSDETYNRVIEDIIGEKVDDRGRFVEVLQDFVKARSVYDQIGRAVEEVKRCGYGISVPNVSDMSLQTPEVIKHSGRYGIRLKAIAPSIHLVKVDVESTFEPIIGSEEQSKELINHLMTDYERDPLKIWDSEIFGRKLSEVVNDGIRAKLYSVPETVQAKYREALQKVVNSGRGGIIAIIL